MITISSEKYNKPITVEIDGVIFYVSKIGAGTQLDLSQLVTKITKAKTDALNMTATDKDNEEKIAKAMEKVSGLLKEFENTFKKLFSDQNDGKDVEKLFNRVGFENIPKLLSDIYEQDKANNV